MEKIEIILGIGGKKEETIKFKVPALSFGVDKGSVKLGFNDHFFSYGVADKFYKLGGSLAGYDKQDFQYYKIETYENSDIGDIYTIDGQEFIVCEKRRTYIYL